jgi:hypothetical protein
MNELFYLPQLTMSFGIYRYLWLWFPLIVKARFATLPPAAASHESPVTVTIEGRNDRKENHGWIGSSGS